MQTFSIWEKSFNVSVRIGTSSSRMHPVDCGIDISGSSNIIRSDLLDLIRLDSIRQCNMPEVQGVSDIKLNVSGTIIVYLETSESCTPVTFDIVHNLVVPVLLVTSFSDGFIK